MRDTQAHGQQCDFISIVTKIRGDTQTARSCHKPKKLMGDTKMDRHR
jgi:hypothetical protein